MNRPVYLGPSILELSKTVMYEFWYDYVKPKYEEKSKLCYMDAGSFIVYINTVDVYKDITKNVERKFDTSNYVLERLLPKEKDKKVIGITKDGLGAEIMTVFVGLRAKTYSCLIDDDSENKTAKSTKKFAATRKLKAV